MDNSEIKQIRKVQEWLEIYEEKNVEDIISFYEKENGVKENVKKYYRKRLLHEQQAAEESMLLCLEVILHKKLFNAQCLWRANELELPFKNTWSVDKYKENIFEATFLEPITQEELDVFIAYYLSDEFEPFDTIIAQNHERLVAYARGQKYESFFSTFDDIMFPDPHYPNWYRWYDQHFDTAELLYLPDHRLEAEQVLISAFNKKKNINLSGFAEGVKNMDLSKTLSPIFPQFLAFAEHMKDFRMRTFFKTHTEQQQEIDTEEGINWMYYLEDIFFQKVPIDAADDWRDAIRDAGFRHLQHNTIKQLPGFYEQYLHDPEFRPKHFNEEKWKYEITSEEEWEKTFEEGREYIKQYRKDKPED